MNAVTIRIIEMGKTQKLRSSYGEIPIDVHKTVSDFEPQIP